MDDHREHPRNPATWPVRLWLNDYCSLLGETVNASAHEAWVYFSWLPSDVLRVGEAYRIQMGLETKGKFACTATVRRIGPDGVGLEIGQDVADALINLAPGGSIAGQEPRPLTPSHP